MRGLLDPALARPVRCANACSSPVGGGMGSLLGPADGLYHDLGVTFADQGIGTVRVGYRKPNDLARCVHDSRRRRPRRAARHACFVVDGPLVRRRGRDPDRRGARHALPRGVTLRRNPPAARSLSELGDTPLLLFHGTDEDPAAGDDRVVQMLAGHGEIVLLPGDGHLLSEAVRELRDRLDEWIRRTFAE